MSSLRSAAVTRIPRIDVYCVQISEDGAVEETVGALKHDPNVVYAEPNYIARIADIVPNDSLFKYQYALLNSGQAIGDSLYAPRGKAGADIKATSAWAETTGSEKIVIAVVDTGVDLAHPDLQNKIFSSGRDFANSDDEAADDHGHGTMVAGIAAAEANNNEGIAGVAWKSKILPVKVMDNGGMGSYNDISAGIVWAVDNGAHVINLSVGGIYPSYALEDAVKYAHSKNVPIIAAAGNGGSSVLYPAAYDDYCLAVTATDHNDERADFSNIGPEVDVAAPGVMIQCSYPTYIKKGGGFYYAFGYGTSFATPHVTGLAALIKGLKASLKAADVYNIIRFSSDDVNAAQYPGKDSFIGWGRINMSRALVPIIISH